MREARRWSQAKLAKLSKIHEQTISRIESGENAPTIETVDKLAKAFGVDIARMFSFVPQGTIDESQLMELLNSSDEKKKQAAWSIISILMNL